MRIYDPRIGRFLSVDPIASDFSWNSTYAFAENDPINFVDLDGLERGRPSSRPGRGGRTIGFVEEMARSTAERLREGERLARERELREQRRRDESQRITEEKLGIRERMVNMRRKFNDYIQNALTSAQFTLAGDNQGMSIAKNQLSGNIFEKYIYKEMLKNPNYVNVVRQVTFVVEGSNGTTLRVRIDNVGIKKDGTLDLVEAKFSIYGISKNNVSQSLTLNQKDFFTMMVVGDVASIKFVGGPAKAAQIGMTSGTEVTGKISSIQIVGSSGPSNQQSQTNPSQPANSSTPVQTTDKKSLTTSGG
jgi:hypothetical protein